MAVLSFSALRCWGEEFSIVESNRIQLDNDLMLLEGPVVLENELGNIRAGKATLNVSKRKGKIHFHDAILEDDVLISIRGEGELRCQHADFRREEGIAVFSSPENEEFVTYSSAPGQGKEGLSSFFLKSKMLTLKIGDKESPEGEGNSQIKEIEAVGEVAITMGGQVTARSNKAVYGEDTIILSGDAQVDFGDYGLLKTSDELLVKKNRSGGIDSIRCLGNSEYRCENEEKNLDMVLLCGGEIFIDHQNKKIHLYSEVNNGETDNNDKQIYFRDHLGKVFADEALIRYDLLNGKFDLQTITLNGNVRLLNRGGAIVQYAMAEQVIYEHETKNMNFKSAKPKRVLFYDKVNNLQVSAPEIKMRRDKDTKKQQFQGIGDVRFNFAEKEYEQIRKRFLLEKKNL